MDPTQQVRHRGTWPEAEMEQEKRVCLLFHCPVLMLWLYLSVVMNVVLMLPVIVSICGPERWPTLRLIASSSLTGHSTRERSLRNRKKMFRHDRKVASCWPDGACARNHHHHRRRRHHHKGHPILLSLSSSSQRSSHFTVVVVVITKVIPFDCRRRHHKGHPIWLSSSSSQRSSHLTVVVVVVIDIAPLEAVAVCFISVHTTTWHGTITMATNVYIKLSDSRRTTTSSGEGTGGGGLLSWRRR